MKEFLSRWFSFLYPIRMEKKPSALHGQLERSWQYGREVIDSTNANQSFGQLHRLFQKLFSDYRIASRAIKQVLVLGFGAGSVAKILLEEMSLDVQIEGVERDPQMLFWAKKRFANESRIHLVEADAQEFLKADTKQYDLIVSDLFCDDRSPDFAFTLPYRQLLLARMKSGGILMANYMPSNEDEKTRIQEWMQKGESEKAEWYCRSIFDHNQVLIAIRSSE